LHGEKAVKGEMEGGGVVKGNVRKPIEEGGGNNDGQLPTIPFKAV